jgi:hypothetical protein
VTTDASLAPIIIATAAVITIGTNWYYHRTQEKRSRTAGKQSQERREGKEEQEQEGVF